MILTRPVPVLTSRWPYNLLTIINQLTTPIGALPLVSHFDTGKRCVYLSREGIFRPDHPLRRRVQQDRTTPPAWASRLGVPRAWASRLGEAAER